MPRHPTLASLNLSDRDLTNFLLDLATHCRNHGKTLVKSTRELSQHQALAKSYMKSPIFKGLNEQVYQVPMDQVMASYENHLEKIDASVPERDVVQNILELVDSSCNPSIAKLSDRHCTDMLTLFQHMDRRRRVISRVLVRMDTIASVEGVGLMVGHTRICTNLYTLHR